MRRELLKIRIPNGGLGAIGAVFVPAVFIPTDSDVVGVHDFIVVFEPESEFFEFDFVPEDFIGRNKADVIPKVGYHLCRSILSIVEIYANFKSSACVCGGHKKAAMSHCRACYASLPPEKQRALYKRFREGYEQAFLDSLIYLVDIGRTDADKIRAVVPEKANGGL